MLYLPPIYVFIDMIHICLLTYVLVKMVSVLDKDFFEGSLATISHILSSPVVQCVAQRTSIRCSNLYGGWFTPLARYSVRLTYKSNTALWLLESLRISHNKFLLANKWILILSLFSFFHVLWKDTRTPSVNTQSEMDKNISAYNPPSIIRHPSSLCWHPFSLLTYSSRNSLHCTIKIYLGVNCPRCNHIFFYTLYLECQPGLVG